MKNRYKLSCGCEPDASGYGYCGQCEIALKRKIWANMPEDKKQYDRRFDPAGSAHLDDITSCCSCHIHPPCSYCTNKNEEENE